MVIITNTFTAQHNQPIYEDRHYYDLPSETKLEFDILEQWVVDNGVATARNYNEDTSSVEVILICSEETFQSFLLFMNNQVGDQESWINKLTSLLMSIGFDYSVKIETIS